MSLAERITIDPEICHGKPTIRGLRHPVETILELLSSGMTVDELLEDYEDLEREDILAAPVVCCPPEPDHMPYLVVPEAQGKKS